MKNTSGNLFIDARFWDIIINNNNNNNNTGNINNNYNNNNTSNNSSVPDDINNNNNERIRDLVVLVILGVMITVINGLIVISFLIRRKLRKRPANIMICSQACTDLFTALVYIPVKLVDNETTYTLRWFLVSLFWWKFHNRTLNDSKFRSSLKKKPHSQKTTLPTVYNS